MLGKIEKDTRLEVWTKINSKLDELTYRVYSYKFL